MYLGYINRGYTGECIKLKSPVTAVRIGLNSLKTESIRLTYWIKSIEKTCRNLKTSLVQSILVVGHEKIVILKF